MWTQAGEVNGTVLWLAVGKKLPTPEGQRWPSPSLYFWYHHGIGLRSTENPHGNTEPQAYPDIHEYDPTLTKS